MSEWKIEKGIPVPERGGGPGGVVKYPLAEMNVGDSVLIPCAGVDALREYGRIAAASWSYGKRHGIKFTIRRVDGGVRVWRVE